MNSTQEAIARDRQGTLFAFNYDQLNPQVRETALSEATEIRGLLKLTRDRVVEIGQKLTLLKQKLGKPFRAWVKYEFDWSDRTANRFMQAASFNTNNPQLAEFILDISALYLLSEKSCPIAAVEEARDRATAGEEITHALAKEIIAKYKPSKPSKISPSAESLVPQELEPLLQEAVDKAGVSAIDWVKEILLDALRSLGLFNEVSPTESEATEDIITEETTTVLTSETAAPELSPEQILEQIEQIYPHADYHIGRCLTYPDYYLVGFKKWNLNESMDLWGQKVIFQTGQYGKIDLTNKIATVIFQSGTELKLDLGVNNVWTKERAIVTVPLERVKPYLFEVGTTAIVKQLQDEKAWIGTVVSLPDFHHQFIVVKNLETEENVTIFSYNDSQQIRVAFSAIAPTGD